MKNSVLMHGSRVEFYVDIKIYGSAKDLCPPDTSLNKFINDTLLKSFAKREIEIKEKGLEESFPAMHMEA